MQLNRWTQGALLLVLGGAGILGTACGGSHAASGPPATAAARPQPSVPEIPPPPASPPGAAQDQDDGDVQLVVAADVVERCPMLALVRSRIREFDPDTVWLVVLESLADCMGQNGPMSSDVLGVSGDEAHRHAVRRILGSRGIAPTRVVATRTSAAGAAECQGGQPCDRRIEITVVP